MARCVPLFVVLGTGDPGCSLQDSHTIVLKFVIAMVLCGRLAAPGFPVGPLEASCGLANEACAVILRAGRQ